MIVYFADRKLNIQGQASTGLPKGLKIIEDTKSEDVETGVAVFECTISFDANTRATAEACAEVGNYILRSNDNENEFYTIIDTEIDTASQEAHVYAEDAGLDLLNEIVGAYAADKAYPVAHYIEKFTYDSGFVIGTNEATDLTRKLAWDGESTVTERIASVATQFGGCEVSYSFDIKGLEVTKKYINIHKKRGKDIGAQLRLNKEVDRIVTTKSIANLATGLQCVGGTPEDKEDPITLQGYKYDDGDFYVSGTRLYSRKALEKWTRYQWAKEPNKTTEDGHIVRQFSYDTTSQEELCAQALAELKKVCEIEVNYEVDVTKFPENIKVGDRINIIDDAGALYLSSRILKLETSIVEGVKKATLGEHLLKDDGISQRIEDLAAQFAGIAALRQFYTWIAYADDDKGTGITLDPTNKAYIGTATNRLVEKVDISDPSVFTWARYKGRTAYEVAVDNGFEGTEAEWLESLIGADGGQGIPGDTTYMHIAYGTSSTGANFSTTWFEGASYMGTCTDFNEADPTTAGSYTWAKIQGESVDSVINHYLATASASGVTHSTSGWTTDVQDVTADKKYLWNYEIIKDTLGNVISKTDPCIIGTYGKGIKSITEYYQVSSSASTTPTSWVTTIPTLTATNKYLWNYETITYSDGTTSDSNKRVIGVYGDKGQQGDAGQGVVEVTTEYYKSTSNTTQTGGSWSSSMPTWETDYYLWIRTKIVYENPTATEYTTPVLDSTWEAAQNATEAAGEAAGAVEELDKVVVEHETKIQKLIDRIAMLVTADGEGTLWEQDAGGWSFNFGTVNALTAQMEELSSRIKFGETSSGEPYIELTAADNSFKVQITNKAIQFSEDNVIPTTISTEAMETERAVAKQELQIGGFVWKKRSSGNVGLVWKGE